ncbi:MAG TPA: hypothetical protein VFD69_18225 [Vicinamibacterales bacterium]|nr:hypothetical protein [Vicinamibacterales bacterium]
MRRLTSVALVACACVMAAACGRQEDTATPVAAIAASLGVSRAEAGAPLTVTYTFSVPAGASALPADRWVFVHALDESKELLWTDDHAPPTPTQSWPAGEPVTYTRTMFVPRNTTPGQIRLEAGVFSRSSGERLPLAGQDRGMRSYEVATVAVTPAANPVVAEAGWHDAESGEAPGREWRWSRRESHLSFANPKAPVTLYLQFDQPVASLPASQAVEVRGPSGVLATLTVPAGASQVAKVQLTADQLGAADRVDVTVAVSSTFVPAATPQLKSTDTRELGVRLLNAFVEPKGTS